MKYTAVLGAVAVSASTAVSAGELVLGLGIDDALGAARTEAAAIVLEYHFDPFWEGERAKYSWAGGLQLDTDHDVWLGLGIAARWELNRKRVFFEASFMAGYYSEGFGGSPLGSELEFRTLLGVGYQLSDIESISVAIDHKSNGGISARNPGSETLQLRYRRSF